MSMTEIARFTLNEGNICVIVSRKKTYPQVQIYDLNQFPDPDKSSSTPIDTFSVEVSPMASAVDKAAKVSEEIAQSLANNGYVPVYADVVNIYNVILGKL